MHFITLLQRDTTLLEKFRNVPVNFWQLMCPIFTSIVLGINQQTCSKVQKYYLQNPQTSLKKSRNNPEKLSKNKFSAASLGVRTEAQRVEMRHSIY